MSTTAEMNLTLPTVDGTTGPEWAEQTNANWELVDSHDHTSGHGVQIPVAGLDIDADLDFNSNDAIGLRSVRLEDATAALAAATDLSCLYQVDGDLYWNNGDGTAVQVTNGGSVSGSSGTISGLPSGTASAAFATSTFAFRQATNQAAIMDVGPVRIRDTAALANYIGIISPSSLASSYDITLPGALPVSTKFLRISSTGVVEAAVAPDASTLEVSGSTLQIKDSGVTTAKINALAVTRAKLEAVGQQVSSSPVSAFSGSSASYATVTNATVSITTTGRPILIMLVPNGTGEAYLGLTSSASADQYAYLRISVTGSATTTVGGCYFGNYATTSGYGRWEPPGIFGTCLYAAAAGTYTLTLQYKVANAATSVFYASTFNLVAFEL